MLGSNLITAPIRIGPRSNATPYDTVAAAAVQTLSDGSKTFVGPRDEAFYIDINAIFDLLNISRSPLGTGPAIDGTAGFNVHTMALQIPVTRLTDNPASDTDPDWSPDGRHILFTSFRDAGNREIYVMNADGSGQTRLTNDPADDDHARWSPNGQRIVWMSDLGPRDLTDQVYVMNADGSEPTRLTNEPTVNNDPSWSPNGRQIVFVSRRGGNPGIYVMNADGSEPTGLTNAQDHDPSWSPDGRQIVFTSLRDGCCTEEIYVMAADGSGQTRLTNDPGFDFQPRWLVAGAR